MSLSFFFEIHLRDFNITFHPSVFHQRRLPHLRVAWREQGWSAGRQARWTLEALTCRYEMRAMARWASQV